MVQQLNTSINGKLYDLQVETGQYNGHAVYYLLNNNISELFDHLVPDNLVLMDNGGGFTCSPRPSEMEGGYIVQQIWDAIVKAGNGNPA